MHHLPVHAVPDIFRAANSSSATIAVLLILIAAGTALTYYLTLSQVPQQVTALLSGASTYEVLLIINIVFLFSGMFIDPNSAIIVLTPLIFRRPCQPALIRSTSAPSLSPMSPWAWFPRRSA
jgi:TRAP-type C4-dicarboxylate transport system permease large subunit